MDLEENTIESKEIYAGEIIKVRYDLVQLPDGKRSGREIVEHSGGVTVIAVKDDGNILLVEQYRKPAEESLLELPAGKLEKGEEPIACARRELMEETGFAAGRMDYLFSFYTTPGFCNEVLHLFLATDLREVGGQTDEDENIILHQIGKEEILDMIKSGKIKDSKTIIGLLYYLNGDCYV